MSTSASQLAALAVTGVQGAAWAAWGVLAVGVAWAVVRARPRVEVVLLAAATALALALRGWAPAVQHDLNDRLSEIHRRADDLSWLYTHGLVSLVRVGTWAGIAPDDVRVFHAVAVLGALTVPLVYAVARQLGGSATAGAVAALVAGGLGLHVRYSHTDAPQIVEAFLTVVAAAALLEWRVARVRGLFALASLSLALAAACRPESIVVPALLVAWSAACGVSWSWRELAALAVCVALVAGVDLAMVVSSHGGAASRNVLHPPALWVHGPAAVVTWNTAFVPAGLGALALVGAWLAPTRRMGIATIALSVALGSLVLNPEWSIAARPSWCVARHQLRVVPWTALLAGLGAGALASMAAGRLPAWGGVVRAGLGVLVAAATASTLPDAYARFTHADEYAFVRGALPRVSERCRLVTITDRGVDHGLAIYEIPASLGRAYALGGLDVDWVAAGDLGTTCVVYYRSSLCAAVVPGEEDRDYCAAFEARVRLTPIVEGALASRGWLWESYRDSPVRVGFYRVEGTR